MGKKQSSKNAGIGDSLKNSLSKLTGRVTLKAPSQEDMEKARSTKVADKPRPATPTPMSAPQTEKAKPSQATPKAMQKSPAAKPAQAAAPAQAARPAAQPAQKAQPAQVAQPAPQAQPAPAPAPAQKAQPAAAAKPAPAPVRKAQPAAAPTQAVQTARPVAKAAAEQPVMAGKGVNTLSNDVVIEGQLRFTDRLAFNGNLKGEIESDGALAVQKEAVIEASITVNSIFVEGKVVGDIIATESVRLAASAIVIGDISTGNLTVEPEATFQGQARIGKTLPAASGQVAEGAPINGTINSKMPAPAQAAATTGATVSA